MREIVTLGAYASSKECPTDREKVSTMADQTRKPKPKKEEEQKEAEATKTSEETSKDMDELLDEIDEVLESNAEEFVRSYIQKGGQ
jgi:ubiquitin-like protein Pup